MAGSNIHTARMAPVGTGGAVGLAMLDATVGSARLVQLQKLGPPYHDGWTIEWLRTEQKKEIYRIRNDDMGLYLTMSNGDQANSRIWGGVLSTDPGLVKSQEFILTQSAVNTYRISSHNGFVMRTIPGEPLSENTELCLDTSNQDWQV
jgi:hypothetical protein